jgi:gliding motility-associated lipoprotein GldB
MRISKPLFFSLISLLTFACGKKEATCTLDEAILDQDINLQITRLEDEFFGAKTADDYKFLMEKHPEFVKEYLQLDLYPNSDSLIAELLTIHQDSTMRTLYDSVKLEFQDFSQIEKDLENAFKAIKYNFPEFQIPKVYTFVSGFNSDLIVTEELIVIGLDYFLPATHTFQPDQPRYLADRFEAAYIVPMLVSVISSRFNSTNPADKTLLAEMIYYGKSYYFTKAILPCTSDQYIIGYTPDQIVESFDNEEYIWAHFIENELLYETNPFELRKYVGEAPFTDEISTKAPGRIGRWLGWNIVEDYMMNNEASLSDLMGEDNAEKIFRQSGYRPRPPSR